MTVLSWIGLVLAIFALLLAVFVIIAKKGRALRKNQPLPPPATRCYFEWKNEIVKIECPFYLGSSENSNLVLPAAIAEYEACIFQHNSRFAFQTLKGGGEIRVNGQETLAGYLWDGDSLVIAGETLRFRCS